MSATKIYLSILGLVPLVVQSQSLAPYTIHGIEFQDPVMLRVLIHRRKPGEKLRVKGGRLLGEDGQLAGETQFDCRYRRQLFDAPFEGLSTANNIWQCKGNRLNFEINRPLKIKSALTGRIQVDSLPYRNLIEISAEADDLLVINHVPMDQYLAGLVNKEISSSYPEEAIKAQIIAARSYALAMAVQRRKQGMSYDILNTQHDQVYQGAKYEDSKSRRLSLESTGQILLYSSNVLKAYYHSSSGGHTELPTNVWGKARINQEGAYKAEKSPYDEIADYTFWKIKLSPKLGQQWFKIGDLEEIKVLKRSEGQRVKKLLIQGSLGSRNITGPEFRRLLGSSWIRSTLFWVKKEGKSWTLNGRGWGHGVGMSQIGAKYMAKAGKSSQEILKFYYPNAELGKIHEHFSLSKQIAAN